MSRGSRPEGCTSKSFRESVLKSKPICTSSGEGSVGASMIYDSRSSFSETSSIRSRPATSECRAKEDVNLDAMSQIPVTLTNNLPLVQRNQPAVVLVYLRRLCGLLCFIHFRLKALHFKRQRLDCLFLALGFHLVCLDLVADFLHFLVLLRTFLFRKGDGQSWVRMGLSEDRQRLSRLCNLLGEGGGSLRRRFYSLIVCKCQIQFLSGQYTHTFLHRRRKRPDFGLNLGQAILSCL